MDRKHFAKVRTVSLVPIALLLLLASCSSHESAAPPKARDDAVAVSVAKVELIPLDRTLPVVGTVCAKDEATIGAQVEGQVEKTFVDFGERVQAGRELALIDTTAYQSYARQAEANLAKAKANLINAEQNLKRIGELQKEKISSASEFDLATAQAEQARAEVKSADAAYAIAELNLERSHVRAPFGAAVAERIANSGDYLKIGSPLFRLVNDTVLKFIMQAPERYATQVKLEQLVQFSVDAWPGETFSGKVYLISPSVNTATRSFNLGALVPNPDGRLKANMFARGELLLERDVPTPVVPMDAVLNFAGVSKAFVVTNGVVHSCEITVGRVKDGRVEVLTGLIPGETVVVSGQTKLFEGTKVRVKEAAVTAASLR